MTQIPNINFSDYLYGMERGRGGRALLLKAIGLAKYKTPHVLDTTGGLLRDAFFMARFGAEVTVIERSPVLIDLINQGLNTLPKNISLTFIAGDAIELMPQLPAFDVIYLDPMFREEKSAKAKKDLQFLQELHQDEGDDAEILFKSALDHAKFRVVVKRPLHAPCLALKKPDWSLSANTIRFDVYLRT